MAYSHRANLGQKIIDKGHNLFLTKRGQEWTGYLGQADFEGISILKGNSIYSLRPTGEILGGWRTPTVAEDDNITHLFCAKQAKRDRSIWRYQEIWRWRGYQGKNFNQIEKSRTAQRHSSLSIMTYIICIIIGRQITNIRFWCLLVIR